MRRIVRVLAAMSGGVDSAVAAARLVEAGHEVTAVHLALRGDGPANDQARGCWSPQHAQDAQQVAERLGIEFQIWDFAERFRAEVVEGFLAEYSAGRTPNPCLRCNEKIKFAALLERGLERGFDLMATGHYARVVEVDGRVSLYRSAETAKDQSYVLGVLEAEQLRRLVFPLGADSAKAAIRQEAAARGLGVADKPDSLDICFIPSGDTREFLHARLGSRPGDITTIEGEVLGRHDGTHQFTIGQRHGLHLSVPAADGRPRYVVGLEPRSNQVIVGPREALAVRLIEGIRPTWTETALAGSWRGLVQVRAHGAAMPASFRLDGDVLRVELDEPAYGIAPGQGAVHYDGDRVVGSATISATAA